MISLNFCHENIFLGADHHSNDLQIKCVCHLNNKCRRVGFFGWSFNVWTPTSMSMQNMPSMSSKMLLLCLAAVTASSRTISEPSCSLFDMQQFLYHIVREPKLFCTDLLSKASLAYRCKQLCQDFSKIHCPV